MLSPWDVNQVVGGVNFSLVGQFSCRRLVSGELGLLRPLIVTAMSPA